MSENQAAQLGTCGPAQVSPRFLEHEKPPKDTRIGKRDAVLQEGIYHTAFVIAPSRYSSEVRPPGFGAMVPIMTATRYRTCNVCEAMCGMAITVEDGRVTEVRADPDDVFSRGHICPKGSAMREVLEDPDRLRHPVRRTPAGWQRIGWDQALDEAAEGLTRVRQD